MAISMENATTTAKQDRRKIKAHARIDMEKVQVPVSKTPVQNIKACAMIGQLGSCESKLLEV